MSKPLDEKQIRRIIEEELTKRVSELKTKEPVTREEFLKAMELMDKRFQELIDIMNRRFEEVNQRFEEVNQRFEEVNQRFEKSDTRFQELVETMNRRFEKVLEGQMLLRVAIGSLGRRSGIRLEKTILKLLQRVLEQRDIDINKVQWIELFDEAGEVFTRNYRTDIDVLIRDGLHFLMEIKYQADNRDIYHFLKVAELYTLKYQRPNKLLLLTLEIDPKTQEYAESQKIEVITGDYN
ncbi:MAG: DUF3782 domain-containing protein [Candidatus Helarchaeota archaeon]